MVRKFKPTGEEIGGQMIKGRRHGGTRVYVGPRGGRATIVGNKITYLKKKNKR